MLGGQGAPLVPIGDRLLFADYDFCLNIGGFSNISYECDGERQAFDISPVNYVLNHYCRQRGLEFDRDGLIARSAQSMPNCSPVSTHCHSTRRQARSRLAANGWRKRYFR